jgi:hypothetical protein
VLHTVCCAATACCVLAPASSVLYPLSSILFSCGLRSRQTPFAVRRRKPNSSHEILSSLRNQQTF